MDNGVSAGIRWGAFGSDMIPMFEEHTARLEKDYDLIEWYCMDRTERALIVAIRRIDIATKNHQSEAEIREAKRNSKKGGKR